VVRTFAVRALSRFVNDSSNIDILDLFLEMLPLEQNAVSVAIESIGLFSF
jgi:condensin complex subunit 3